MYKITNGTVLSMKGKPIENGEVLVDGTKIVEIGKKLQVKDDCKIIDAAGGYIMPGIIDAHCHVGMWEDGMGFEGDDVNEITDPATPQLRAIDAVNPMDKSFEEAYKNGITCVCTGPGSANVIGGTFVIVKTYGKRIDNMVVKEPAAMKAAFGENPKRCYNAKHQLPSTRMGTASILREYLFKTKEYMKAKDKNTDKQPAFDMKLESLIPVLNKELPLKVHAHRADDIFTAIRIAKEFDINITLDHCTEGHLIADELAKEGYPAIIGPTLSTRSKIELSNLTFETPKILAAAGIKFALMTDHPVIPLHYLPLSAALAVKAGLDEETALKALTINPAEILGISDRVGSLEKGKDADIVIFDKHPLDIQTIAKVVMINGEIVSAK